VRHAVKREDERLVQLVEAHDRLDAPIAETWRLVGAGAAAQGLLRPSYALVRRLVLAHRERVLAQRRLREIARDAGSTVAAGRVPDVSRLLERLDDAQRRVAAAEELRVSETQARPR
jgi:hypothetical protein